MAFSLSSDAFIDGDDVMYVPELQHRMSIVTL